MAESMQLISPFQLTHSDDPFPLDLYGLNLLAQGDSWFSIGAIPPTRTTNVLQEIRLQRSAVAVNCAAPGAVLRHMVDTMRAPVFKQLLSGNVAHHWHAILISGGGNDLIDALQVKPSAPVDVRLLLTAAEVATPGDPASYLSAPGWATFCAYLGQVFNELLDLRDSKPVNRQTPLFLHNYALLMPRPAPAGAGFGPWVHKALVSYAVPPEHWLAIGGLLMTRLSALLAQLITDRLAQHPGAGAIQLIDTQAAGLVLAEAGSTGVSGDFANEIHPTRAGYAKAAQRWAAVLDGLPSA
jgi:hypothetical protein